MFQFLLPEILNMYTEIAFQIVSRVHADQKYLVKEVMRNTLVHNGFRNFIDFQFLLSASQFKQ